MGQWYKIPKDSPTGKRLQAVSDRMDAFREAFNIYKEKYGVQSAAYYSRCLCDVLAFVFDGEPDAGTWYLLKGGDWKGYYKPYKNTEAYKDWQKLRKLRVERCELDRAMGASSDFPYVGIHWEKNGFFFAHYRLRPNYPLGEECEPITDAEYRMMTGDKDNWDD